MTRQVEADELLRYFKRLPDRLKSNYYRKMLRAGGGVLIKRIRQNVKSMTSSQSASVDRLRERTTYRVIRSGRRAGEVVEGKTSLAKSITQRVVKSRKHGYITVVGAKYPEGQHAHLVERGHRIVGHRPGRVDTGKRTRPIPFQRTAEVEAAHEVLQAMAVKLKAGVKQERV